jgi:hypothetical protein
MVICLHIVFGNIDTAMYTVDVNSCDTDFKGLNLKLSDPLGLEVSICFYLCFLVTQ